MFRRLLACERGAVSLFLIIIITAIFLMNTVLIDFAIIMSAKVVVEKSLKAALRSELADFDEVMYKNYGIFTKKLPGDLYIEQIFSKNITNEKHGFAFVAYNIDHINLETVYGHQLALLPVYRNQLLESMKYRAPVNYFKNFAEVIQEPLQEFTKLTPDLQLLGELADLVIERNQLIEGVIELQLAANTLTTLAPIQGDNYLLISDLVSDLNGIREYKLLLSDASIQLESAQFINRKYSELARTLSANYGADNLGPMTNLLSSINQSLTEQQFSLETIIGLLEQLIQEGNLQESNTIERHTIENYLDELADLIRNYNFEFSSNNKRDNSLANNQRLLEELTGSITDQHLLTVKQQESGLFRLKNYFNLLQELTAIDDNSAEIMSLYQQLLSVNEQVENSTSDNQEFSVTSLATDSRKLIDTLANTVSNYLLELRDIAYLEEYAFSYFKAADPQLLNNLQQGLRDGGIGELRGLGLHISDQEIEYIIYGHESTSLNLLSTFKDLFLIRFVFNLVDEFANPALYSTANPVIIFFEATNKAFTSTLKDFYEIAKGEQVPLMSRLFTVEFGYYDYLKLFYFIRGKEDEKLLRQLALTSYHSGIDLNQAFTYGVGEVTVPMNLWFLNRSYTINSRAAYGY